MHCEGLRGGCAFETHPLMAAEGLQAHPIRTTCVGRIDGEQVEHILGELRILLGEEARCQQQRDGRAFDPVSEAVHLFVHVARCC